MRRRALLGTVLIAIGATALSASQAAAQAVPNPQGCSASQLHLDIIQDPSLVRMGDVINYWLDVDNVGDFACRVENVNVTLQFPGRNGDPSATLQPKATGLALAAQAPRIRFGPFAYTVAVDPGVVVLRARTAVVNATLQDIARSPVNINKGISAILFTPSITIDKVGSMTGPAPAPQTVEYTFYVRNGSNPALSEAATAISNVTVTDDKCGNPTYQSGDANGNGKLETSETWQFKCTLTHPAPGTYTNVATASGQNVLNNRPVPVQSPPDRWEVVLTPPPPPPPPAVAVLPAAAQQPPCVIRTPSRLRVRAGERTTIRVRVRNVDAGSRVRITLPGGRVVSARTNANGVAVLRVRPPRSGTARIRVADCSDVERLVVRPARRVAAQRVPRVTG
jgi:hypothetical protein